MKEEVLSDATESHAGCPTTVTLRIKSRATYVQIVSIGTRICRSRPPVAVRDLIVQGAITPGVQAGEYIRKRIPAGFGGAGGVERKRRDRPVVLLLLTCGLSNESPILKLVVLESIDIDHQLPVVPWLYIIPLFHRYIPENIYESGYRRALVEPVELRGNGEVSRGPYWRYTVG